MTDISPTEINSPHKSNKLAKLVALLFHKIGVTIEKANEALVWQPHTTRATFTRLRKRGYNIKRIDKTGKASIYKIRQSGSA